MVGAKDQVEEFGVPGWYIGHNIFVQKVKWSLIKSKHIFMLENGDMEMVLVWPFVFVLILHHQTTPQAWWGEDNKNKLSMHY